MGHIAAGSDGRICLSSAGHTYDEGVCANIADGKASLAYKLTFDNILVQNPDDWDESWGITGGFMPSISFYVLPFMNPCPVLWQGARSFDGASGGFPNGMPGNFTRFQVSYLASWDTLFAVTPGTTAPCVWAYVNARRGSRNIAFYKGDSTPALHQAGQQVFLQFYFDATAGDDGEYAVEAIWASDGQAMFVGRMTFVDPPDGFFAPDGSIGFENSAVGPPLSFTPFNGTLANAPTTRRADDYSGVDPYLVFEGLNGTVTIEPAPYVECELRDATQYGPIVGPGNRILTGYEFTFTAGGINTTATVADYINNFGASGERQATYNLIRNPFVGPAGVVLSDWVIAKLVITYSIQRTWDQDINDYRWLLDVRPLTVTEYAGFDGTDPGGAPLGMFAKIFHDQCWWRWRANRDALSPPTSFDPDDDDYFELVHDPTTSSAGCEGTVEIVPVTPPAPLDTGCAVPPATIDGDPNPDRCKNFISATITLSADGHDDLVLLMCLAAVSTGWSNADPSDYKVVYFLTCGRSNADPTFGGWILTVWVFENDADGDFIGTWELGQEKVGDVCPNGSGWTLLGTPSGPAASLTSPGASLSAFNNSDTGCTEIIPGTPCGNCPDTTPHAIRTRIDLDTICCGLNKYIMNIHRYLDVPQTGDPCTFEAFLTDAVTVTTYSGASCTGGIVTTITDDLHITFIRKQVAGDEEDPIMGWEAIVDTTATTFHHSLTEFPDDCITSMIVEQNSGTPCGSQLASLLLKPI